MTKEELVGIISHVSSQCEKPWTYIEVADKILAALDKEKEGEVVLDNNASLRIPSPNTQPILLIRYGEDLYGKHGQLIFRPTKEPKNEK